MTSLDTFLAAKGFKKTKLQKSKVGHFELTARLNGVSGRFILDTGASHTVIEQGFVKKFKLKLHKKVHKSAAGLGGSKFSSTNSSGNVLSFRNFTSAKSRIITLDLSHVNDALHNHGIKKIHGIIGADFMNKYNAVIDYKQSSLYLKQK